MAANHWVSPDRTIRRGRNEGGEPSNFKLPPSIAPMKSGSGYAVFSSYFLNENASSLRSTRPKARVHVDWPSFRGLHIIHVAQYFAHSMKINELVPLSLSGAVAKLVSEVAAAVDASPTVG